MQARGEDLGAVLDALPLSGARRVLEAGCGSGALTRALARRLGPGAEVCGWDLDRESVRRARELARREGVANARFVHGDAMDLAAGGRAGRGFDGAVCRYVLMYMAARGQARPWLRALAGRVRAGGWVAAVEPDVNWGQERFPPAPEPLATLLGGLVPFYRERGLVEWRAGLRLFHDLRAAGLTGVRVALVEARAIQGGWPPVLVEHGAMGAEALLAPCAQAMGMAHAVELAARQWREYLAGPGNFLYTPVLAGIGRVPTRCSTTIHPREVAPCSSAMPE